MMADQEFSYRYLQPESDSESETDHELNVVPEEVETEEEGIEEGVPSYMVCPKFHHLWNPIKIVMGSMIQTVSNFCLSTNVRNTAEIVYDVFDYSAKKIDSIFYTTLTYFYLSFAYLASSLFSDSEKAYRDLMYDGSNLLYTINSELDITDSSQRFIVLTSSSAFDLYLPFTFLSHLPFKIWDADSFLNRTFIPSSFILKTTKEVNQAIEDGYSIVIHKKACLSDVNGQIFSEIVANHPSLTTQVVNPIGVADWFPYSSDYSIYTFPQDIPIQIQLADSNTISSTVQPTERRILSVMSLFFLYPFQSTFNLILKYTAIRNLRYKQTCFLNPETLLFLALIWYR